MQDLVKWSLKDENRAIQDARFSSLRDHFTKSCIAEDCAAENALPVVLTSLS